MIRISSVPSKKMQQVIRTFLLVKSFFFTNRLITRRSGFVFPLHTLRDTARFILAVNNIVVCYFQVRKARIITSHLGLAYSRD